MKYEPGSLIDKWLRNYPVRNIMIFILVWLCALAALIYWWVVA